MTQKQTNEKKAIKRYEMNKNYYITVDQIINKLDMIYKFFESKEIFDPEYLREYLGEKVSEHDKKMMKDLTEKITSTVKDKVNKDGFSYLDQTNEDGTEELLIDSRGLMNLDFALHNYFYSKSSIMNLQALKDRDHELQSKQIAEIAKDQADQDNILIQVKNSDERLNKQQFDDVDDILWDCDLSVFSYDLISDIEKAQPDLMKYQQFDDDFKNRFTRDFEHVKVEIACKNIFYNKMVLFRRDRYIKDYFMRELHTVKIRGKQIVYEGYSEYDRKLQNPLEWYCYNF